MVRLSSFEDHRWTLIRFGEKGQHPYPPPAIRGSRSSQQTHRICGFRTGYEHHSHWYVLLWSIMVDSVCGANIQIRLTPFSSDFALVLDPNLVAWIGHGRRWPGSSKRPRFLNDAFKAAVRYPRDYDSFVPASDLSIVEFIAMDLPRVSTTPSVDFVDELFSFEPAFAEPLPILAIDMPPADLLHKIWDMLPQKWLDGYQSIRGLSSHYNIPFCIISLWMDLLSATTMQPRWMRAYSWFHNIALPLPVPAHLSYIPNVIERFFEVMGWDVHLCGPSSLKSTHLIELFGRGMLSGRIVESGMEMFRNWASQDPGLRTVQVETFDF